MGRPGGHSFGIVGGLGALASADVFFKLVKAMPAASGSQQSDILLEQHPFHEAVQAGAAGTSQSARKLYVFDMIRSFQSRGVDAVLLPCFISHTFLEELTAELSVPIVDLMAALRQHVAKAYPQVRSIGVLTSDHVIRAGLFERAFDPARYRIVHPGPACQVDDLMAAIYGPEGIKSGRLSGASIAHLRRACQDLANQGAELILPGFTEIPVVLEMLAEGPLRIVDCNQVYAQAAVDQAASLAPRACKVGIVGGVGPAATVDFIDKIVRNTSARRDQDHIKLVLEHNPQIPDRTASLVAGGVDPTIALYATCKKLEAADADLIAIPCNTAHAFVERIQPYLRIPILNMMFETVQHILRRHPGCGVVGLLATDGTLESGVYHEAVVKAGLRLVIPDAARQRMVMEAIYAPWGVKAGHTAGRAREDLIAAIAHLVRDQGAELIILGCTELPLLVAQTEGFPVAGQRVAIIDPTEILACKCVELARQGFMAPVTHAEQGAACEAGAQGQDLQQQFTHGGTDYAGDVDEHGRQRWHAADIGGNDHGEGDHGRTQERDHQG